MGVRLPFFFSLWPGTGGMDVWKGALDPNGVGIHVEATGRLPSETLGGRAIESILPFLPLIK